LLVLNFWVGVYNVFQTHLFWQLRPLVGFIRHMYNRPLTLLFERQWPLTHKQANKVFIKCNVLYDAWEKFLQIKKWTYFLTKIDQTLIHRLSGISIRKWVYVSQRKFVHFVCFNNQFLTFFIIFNYILEKGDINV
jgi:hypothetical protein